MRKLYARPMKQATRRSASGPIGITQRYSDAVVAIVLLRLVIGDAVVVPGMVGEDVAHKLQIGRLVQAAGHDADVRLVRRLPEQVRSTSAAKAPARRVRGSVPPQRPAAREREVLTHRRGRRHKMPADPPAHIAMTADNLSQRPAHFV